MSEINRIELEGLMHDWKSRAEEADVPYLLDLVASLTAERDALRDRYEPLRSWADGAEIDIRDLADQRDDLRGELAALRAVVEEARDEIESWKINANLEVVANEAAVLAILDRVKGE